MNEPTEYSNAWYRKQFRGLNYALNRCLAEIEECMKAVKSSREENETLKASLAKFQIELGRQTDEIAELKESMEKARAVFQELKKQREP